MEAAAGAATASLRSNTYGAAFTRLAAPELASAAGAGLGSGAAGIGAMANTFGGPACRISGVGGRTSGSTRDSAVAVAETLRSRGMRRIALVTEAYHMMRAERCFRKQGLETLPAPCGFRTLKFNAGEWLFPGWNPLSYNEAALHEYGGIAVYWLRGWL